MPLKTVSPATLKQWLDNQEAVVVDVREPAEHMAENITGSTLIPLGVVCKSALPDCKGKKLVIHCHAGKRGATACQKLLAEDPTLEIYHLEGGISAWNSSGEATVTSGHKVLPLDRQVQLTIGLILILGSILGYFTSPLWFLLTGAVGAGLAIAGLTGFCGLAMLIAKMPWNQKSGHTSCCPVK